MFGIDYTTFLDLTVNLVPIGILLFFMVYLPISLPSSSDRFALLVAEGLHLVPLLVLAVVTYVAGQAIDVD